MLLSLLRNNQGSGAKCPYPFGQGYTVQAGSVRERLVAAELGGRGGERSVLMSSGLDVLRLGWLGGRGRLRLGRLRRDWLRSG
jgi:hypothetical protein